MTCRSCGLSLDTSTPLDERNLDPWQPANYLNLFGDPTPASHIAAGHQRLDVNNSFRNDTWLQDFSTSADPGWPVPAPTLESIPFSIHHDGTEPCASMSTNHPGSGLGNEPLPVDTTGQKEPSRPAKRAPATGRGNERCVKKQTLYSNQHSSRPRYVIYQACQCLAEEILTALVTPITI